MIRAMTTRGALLDAWQTVYAAVSRRATLPVLAGVMVEADKKAQMLRLTATDLAVALRVEVQASVEEEFAAVLPAWEFLHWLKALPEGAVTLTAEDGRVRAACCASTGRFATWAAEEFPPIAWALPETQVHVPGDFLKRAARDVAMAAARDIGRPVLEGVVFHCGDDGMSAAASDSYRLAVLRAEVEASEDFAAIIPAEALRKAAPLVAADEVTLGLDEQWVVLALGGGVMMMTQLIEGQYPPYEQIVPQGFASTVRAPRQALARALREMEVFAAMSSRVGARWTATGIQLEAASKALGRGETVVSASLEGEPLEIAFNIHYLQAAVDAVRGDEVTLRGNAPTAPVMVQGVDDKEYFGIIMPMSWE